MPEVAERFAENLAHYREQSGLSVEALAARAEIHRTQVSEYLHARSLPRIDALIRLAGALDVSPGALLEGISFEPTDKSGSYKTKPVKRSG